MPNQDNEFKVKCFPPFDTQLKKITKKFPKSENSINELISSLSKDPLQGGRLAMGDLHLRKIKVGLSAYNLSSRKGLRFVCLIQDDIKTVVPLVIVQKADYEKHQDVEAKIHKELKDMEQYLSEESDNSQNKN